MAAHGGARDPGPQTDPRCLGRDTLGDLIHCARRSRPSSCRTSCLFRRQPTSTVTLMIATPDEPKWCSSPDCSFKRKTREGRTSPLRGPLSLSSVAVGRRTSRETAPPAPLQGAPAVPLTGPGTSVSAARKPFTSATLEHHRYVGQPRAVQGPFGRLVQDFSVPASAASMSTRSTGRSSCDWSAGELGRSVDSRKMTPDQSSKNPVKADRTCESL